MQLGQSRKKPSVSGVPRWAERAQRPQVKGQTVLDDSAVTPHTGEASLSLLSRFLCVRVIYGEVCFEMSTDLWVKQIKPQKLIFPTGSNGPQSFTVEQWGTPDKLPRAHTW